MSEITNIIAIEIYDYFYAKQDNQLKEDIKKQLSYKEAFLFIKKNTEDNNHLDQRTFSTTMAAKYTRANSQWSKIKNARKNKEDRKAEFEKSKFWEKRQDSKRNAEEIDKTEHNNEAALQYRIEELTKQETNMTKLINNERRSHTREVNTLQNEVDKTQKKEKKLRRRNKRIKYLKEQIKRRDNTIRELKEKLNNAREENKILRKIPKINSATKEEVTTIVTTIKKRKAYIPEFRLMCIALLLDCNIAFDKLKYALKYVEHFANIKFSRIPCPETFRNFCMEAHEIAKYFAGSAIANDQKQKTTMHSDGTKKGQKPLLETSATTTSGPVCLGKE